MFLKIEAQAFDAGDFLNIFLRFLGVCGSFSYKQFSYRKKCIFSLRTFKHPQSFSKDIIKLSLTFYYLK